jgi:hypothetical protein
MYESANVAQEPFVLAFYTVCPGLDLRPLRAFRLLRLVRILKLTRYNAAARRSHRPFIIAKEELMLFLFAALIILYQTGAGIYYFGNSVQSGSFRSIVYSLWWASGHANDGWVQGHSSDNIWRKAFHVFHSVYRLGHSINACRYYGFGTC